MKLSEMSRAERRDYLEKAYDAAVQAHAAGELDGPHPSRRIISWAKLGGGNAASDDIKPGAEIDDEEIRGNTSSPISPAAANRAHGRTAVDSATIALQELAIRRSGALDPEALVRAARVQREYDPVGVSNMEKIIDGYSRLR